MKKEERSWEDRVVHFPGTLGDIQTEADRSETASPEEILADELIGALAKAGMTAPLALKTAKFLKTQPHSFAGEKHTLSALDSLVQADSEQLLKQILDRIFEAPKPRLSVGCLKMALGMTHEDLVSQRHWADKQNVSLEHVSNEVESWQELLGLPRTSAQKSAAAKESYRLHNAKKAS